MAVFQILFLAALLPLLGLVHFSKVGYARIQNMDRGPWTTPWTTPNFQQEIAPVNMKIYRRSGYEQKHRLVAFIAYNLEGL